MKKKSAVLTEEAALLVDLTLHNVSASLVKEFAQKIVIPYYRGNLSAALQDLMGKIVFEQDFVLSYVTHIRDSAKP